jgi:hypothetical protein
MLRHFSGPTHKDNYRLEHIYWHYRGYGELCCVLSGDTGGTAFSHALSIEESII